MSCDSDNTFKLFPKCDDLASCSRGNHICLVENGDFIGNQISVAKSIPVIERPDMSILIFKDGEVRDIYAPTAKYRLVQPDDINKTKYALITGFYSYSPIKDDHDVSVAVFSISNTVNDYYAYKRLPGLLISTMPNVGIKPYVKYLSSKESAPVQISKSNGKDIVTQNGYTDWLYDPYDDNNDSIFDIRDLSQLHPLLSRGVNGRHFQMFMWFINCSSAIADKARSLLQTIHNGYGLFRKASSAILREHVLLNNLSTHQMRKTFLGNEYDNFVPNRSDDITGYIKGKPITIGGHLINLVLTHVFRPIDLKWYVRTIISNIALQSNVQKLRRIIETSRYIIGERELGRNWHTPADYKLTLTYISALYEDLSRYLEISSQSNFIPLLKSTFAW
jgi:hypothetical protein